MFTIKHIDTSGNEFLIECDQFVTERRSDGFLQYLAYGPIGSPPNDYIATWCGDDNSPVSTLAWQQLYVMNRFGATVASHRFVQPDFSRDRLAQGADPDLVDAAKLVSA